tara:strand:+ start:7264 stop:7650 length:387 start_codon:yes stop_codon:yes gene_type:complete
MLTTKQQTWHDIEIPDCLEIVGSKSTRYLTLRLSDERQRRTWEMYLRADRTPKTFYGNLFLMPWQYLDEREADLSAVFELAGGLIHKRASVLSGGCGLTFQGFHHEPGTIVFRAMIQAVVTHLERFPL